MKNRNSFVTGRGPVMSNPDASLLPSPYEVPPHHGYRGTKTLIILFAGAFVTAWAFGVFS